LAPSSLFGGSRESLPLSVLSANIDTTGPATPGLHRTATGAAAAAASGSATAAAERTSIYSASGILPVSERNSLYMKQQQQYVMGSGGDGASVRSGLLGHGRAESISGSIGGMTSPLASPREALSERGKNGVAERDDEDDNHDHENRTENYDKEED
jgi:hypothetical protein